MFQGLHVGTVVVQMGVYVFLKYISRAHRATSWGSGHCVSFEWMDALTMSLNGFNCRSKLRRGKLWRTCLCPHTHRPNLRTLWSKIVSRTRFQCKLRTRSRHARGWVNDGVTEGTSRAVTVTHRASFSFLALQLHSSTLAHCHSHVERVYFRIRLLSGILHQA